jgi:hypothetical protein
MLAHRERLLDYFKAVDGMVFIDSDPGGYPGSTNAEFVALLGEYRELLDRLRPGIELIYWPWLGWETYSKALVTHKWGYAPAGEYADLLARLNALNPQPWGILDGLQSVRMASDMKANNEDISHYIRKAGYKGKAISFDYYGVELESPPVTDFRPAAARNAGTNRGGRGTMANAMAPILQLANTFVFARAATGHSVSDTDLVDFADRLIRGVGPLIVASWQALSSSNPPLMWKHAKDLRSAAQGQLSLGDLRGLFLSDGKRFLEDLAMQLEMTAACQDFIRIQASGTPVKQSLSNLASRVDAWLARTGYNNWWVMTWGEVDDRSPWQRGLAGALKALKAPRIDAVLVTGGRKLTAAMRETAAEMRN